MGPYLLIWSLIWLSGDLLYTRSICTVRLQCSRWHLHSWYACVYLNFTLNLSNLWIFNVICASKQISTISHCLLIYLCFNFMQVLPLPNIPFFWCLFRTYSHWRALQVHTFFSVMEILQLKYFCVINDRSDESNIAGETNCWCLYIGYVLQYVMY